jgi:5-methylcytosine-specific restriction endonuclease McrA
VTLSDFLRKRLPVLDPRARTAQPKPSRWGRKAADRKDRVSARQHRDRLRREIYKLDNGRCRRCSRRVFLKIADAPHELAVGHVHEWVPRSLGGDPLDKFNCLLLCSECHKKLHGEVGGRELLIVVHDISRLVRGPVDFIKNQSITLFV